MVVDLVVIGAAVRKESLVLARDPHHTVAFPPAVIRCVVHRASPRTGVGTAKELGGRFKDGIHRGPSRGPGAQNGGAPVNMRPQHVWLMCGSRDGAWQDRLPFNSC